MSGTGCWLSFFLSISPSLLLQTPNSLRTDTISLGPLFLLPVAVNCLPPPQSSAFTADFSTCLAIHRHLYPLSPFLVISGFSWMIHSTLSSLLFKVGCSDLSATPPHKPICAFIPLTLSMPMTRPYPAILSQLSLCPAHLHVYPHSSFLNIH